MSHQTNKIQRQADAGVADAIASVLKNQKFKRMLIFGLRSLSDLCVPPTIRYKENSLALLNSVEGFQALVRAATDHKDDEEVTLLLGKCFFGVSEALKDATETDKNDAQNVGFPTAVSSIVANGLKDEASLTFYLDTLKNLRSMGLSLNEPLMAPGLLAGLNSRTNSTLAASVLNALYEMSNSKPTAEALGTLNAVDKLLAAIEKRDISPGNSDSIKAVTSALYVIKNVVASGKSAPGSLESIIAIMDKAADIPAIQTAGSAALGLMVSPDELAKCLSILKTAPPDSPDRARALTMLSSMSYISSCADEIVKAGGVPMVCEAIAQSAEALKSGKVDAKVTKGLVGACRILGTIAKGSAAERELVCNANGLTSLLKAIEATASLDAEAFTHACLALAPLMGTEKNVEVAMKSNLLKHLEVASSKHKQNADVIRGCTSIMHEVSEHESVAKTLGNSPVLVDSMISGFKHSTLKNNEKFKRMAMKSMLNIVRVEDSAYKKFSKQLDAIVADETLVSISSEMAEVVLSLFAWLAKSEGGLEAMSSGPCVVLTLDALLKWGSSEKGVGDACLTLLEMLATEKDVMTTLQTLDSALSGARRAPQKGLRALAAVNGLSQVPRLSALLAQKKAASIILSSGMSTWVTGTGVFAEQEGMIKAGCSCIENLTCRSTEFVEPVIMDVLNLLQQPGLKVLREKQVDAVSDIGRLLETVCGTQRFQSCETVSPIVDEIIRAMRKQSDSRKIQVSYINSLNAIAMFNESAAKKTIESGALRSVIAYMQKVTMFQDVQEAGLELLLTLAKYGPKYCDNIKAADAVPTVQTAHRRFSQHNPNVQKLSISLIGLLMPEGDVERIVNDNIKIITAALKSGETEKVRIALQSINQVIASPDGAKVAARCDLGKTIEQIVTTAKGPEDQLLGLYTEVAIAAKNMSQRKVGLTNLNKNHAVSHLIDIFERLKNHKNQDEGISAALTASRRCFKHDKDAAQIAFKRNFHTKVCLFAENETDAKLFSQVAACIARMTPRKTIVATPEVRRYISNLCTKIGEEQDLSNLQYLIEALDEMLMDPDDEMMKIIIGKKTLKSLFKIMHDHADDLLMVKRAQRCVDKIAKTQNMRLAIKKPENPTLEVIGRTTKRVVKANKKDADCCASALCILNLCTTGQDHVLLNEINLLPEIEELMDMHEMNEPLMKACGEYLGKLGADEFVKSYMKQIIDACNAKPADLPKVVTRLNMKLATYLAGDLKDPVKVLEPAQLCMDKLAELMAANASDSSLIVSVAAVTRRMAKKRGPPPDNEPLGLKAIMPKMMPCLTELLSHDGMDPIKRPRKFLIDGFNTLADCAKDPRYNTECLVAAKKYKTIPHCLELLKHHANDPDIAAAILAYLGALASTPDGANTLAECRKAAPSRRIGKNDIESDVMDLLHRHRKHPGIIENGYLLIGNMGKNCKQLSPSLRDPAFMHELDVLVDDAQGLAAKMNLHRKLIKKEDKAATIAALKAGVEGNTNLIADETATEADQLLVAAALADFIADAAEAGLTSEVKKSGAVDSLVDMFENKNKNIESVLRVLPGLRRAAAADPDTSAKLARTAIEPLLGGAGDLIGGDYESTKEVLNLLKTVCKDEGNGRVVAQTAAYKSLMDSVQNHMEELDPVEAEEIKLLAEQVKRSVEDDQPQNLTLKQVYEKWKAAKESSEVLDIAENQLVIKLWDFVSDYTEEYSKESHKDLNSELGSEWQAGCLCYRLLLELESNTRPILEKNEANSVFLKAMARQRNDMASQCAVLVANDAVGWADALTPWTKSSNAAAIVAETLKRGREVKDLSNEEREELLMPRMQLVERFAVDRQYFNNTECMAALIGLWDDYDGGKYSVELLKQVFKSMRKIVNDHWVGIILKNNVPARLIEVVDDRKTRIDLLPDVLFLLAALAVVPEIKTMIGELKGVENCLDLLTRSMKNPQEGTSAVQTNDCLALSAITLGHGANLTRFVQSKGLELNIQCMEQAMTGSTIDFDVANAASLLMCNTCFKRDEIKELYGKRGACQAVMKTINRYDGSEDTKAFRCLGTMFKAIGNLALFTPNVTIFLDGHIEKTFADLYAKSDRLPDALVEASLRTLSNLAMENTVANMTRFGVCLVPIISMLKQGQRTSVTMFTLAFDVLGALCRLPANASQFVRSDGITTCLRILNSYSDDYLYANGIHVLGIQTTDPASVKQLIASGVFDFLTSLFESQNGAGPDSHNMDLIISGLRCTRRMLKEQSNVLDFIKSGGLEQLIQLSGKPAEHSMMHLENCRVILNCLAIFPPPPRPPPVPTQQRDDGWDGDVADEGVLGNTELELDRPPSPRSWEAISFTPESASRLIEALCKVMDRDENIIQSRVVRCVLGLVAYFACEKIPDTNHAFFSGQISSVLAKLFDKLEKDAELCKIGCFILNNVAYASEPELYITLRKDRTMRKNLDLAIQTIGGGANKSFCDMTLKLINEKSADPNRFEIHQQWDFPLELTWWDKDKYPNGVQDLPADMKDQLRSGGKFKTVVGDRDREMLFWKSSLDLIQFNWRIAPQEGPWQHTVSVSRICNITKGLGSAALKKANELGSATSKPREGECLVLAAPPSEEFPQGVEINLICGSKRARDNFFDLMNEWREAAAFGF